MTQNMNPEPRSAPEPWRDVAQRFARFNGLVGDIEDPLTWGLDLTEETIAGGSKADPTEERFLRSYRSLWDDFVEVETLLNQARGLSEATEIARMALCSTLAAPYQPPTADHEDFLTAYAEYRAAIREIVSTAEQTQPIRSSYAVNGTLRPAIAITAKNATAIYTAVRHRALIVAGPAELIDHLTVVMRPLQTPVDPGAE